MFDLTQLRCFVTVAEELHFSRAAARLNMTQPPLSRQIQVLERILDAPLLERTSRSVQLTPAGRSFLIEAKRILKLSETAMITAKRVAAGKSGTLRIGYTAVSAYSYMPELIKSIRKSMPDIDFTLKEMVSGEQFEALSSDQIDIGLLRPPIMRNTLGAMRVMAEPLIAALPADHPMSERTIIDIKIMDGQPFVMYAPYESRYMHDLLVSAFLQAQITPKYTQHVSQIHTVLSLVKAGFGLAIVPETAYNLNMAGVVLRPIIGIATRPVELFLVWQKESDNPIMPEILNIARAKSQEVK